MGMAKKAVIIVIAIFICVPKICMAEEYKDGSTYMKPVTPEQEWYPNLLYALSVMSTMLGKNPENDFYLVQVLAEGITLPKDYQTGRFIQIIYWPQNSFAGAFHIDYRDWISTYPEIERFYIRGLKLDGTGAYERDREDVKTYKGFLPAFKKNGFHVKIKNSRNRDECLGEWDNPTLECMKIWAEENDARVAIYQKDFYKKHPDLWPPPEPDPKDKFNYPSAEQIWFAYPSTELPSGN